jgi:hypothetical protein
MNTWSRVATWTLTCVVLTFVGTYVEYVSEFIVERKVKSRLPDTVRFALPVLAKCHSRLVYYCDDPVVLANRRRKCSSR